MPDYESRPTTRVSPDYEFRGVTSHTTHTFHAGINRHDHQWLARQVCGRSHHMLLDDLHGQLLLRCIRGGVPDIMALCFDDFSFEPQRQFL